MVTLLATCNRLGVPIAPDKCEGPVTRLTYLGIEVDTVQMQLRLPEEKLRRVQATVGEWLGRKAGRQRELESLVGLLQHAAKVVCPGRRFVRKIIAVMTTVKDRDHFVHLNADTFRPVLVVRVHGRLEWSRHDSKPRSGGSGFGVRCLRQLGLWSGVGNSLATMEVEPHCSTMGYFA